MAIGIIENSLVIAVLIRVKETRSSINMTIGSLALADIVQCLAYGIFGIGRLHGPRYVMGTFGCENEHFFKIASDAVHQLSIIVMVSGRIYNLFVSSSSPLLSSVKFTLSFLGFMWCICWAGAFTTTHTIWISHLCHVEGHENQYRCIEYYEGGPLAWIISLSILTDVPLLLLLAMYAMVWFLYRKYQTRAELQESSQEILTCSRKQSWNSNFYLLLYALVAVMFQIPAQVYVGSLMRKDDDGITDPENIPLTVIAYRILHYSNCLNSCVNPLIFTFSSKAFRRALVKLVRPNSDSQRENPIPEVD